MSEENGHHGERTIEQIRSLPLPAGWARTSVGQVGEVRLGRQRSPKNRSAEYPTKYIRAANITWSGLDLSDVLDMDFRPEERTNYRLKPGDVLLSEASGSAGEVGKPAIWNGELDDCCFQNTVIRFRPKAVSSKFALVAFLHFARNSVFARVSKGVGIHHLSADRFASMPFLLPPHKEQRRIVAKIEELFSDLDAGVAALERAKANLRRYRAAVLKAAVEGKLTEEWRAKHPDFEPASKLLERILVERRNNWEANQLAKFAAAKKEPPKNWREKYVEPSPPDTTGLPELPTGWCWASVDQLLVEPTCNGISIKGTDSPPGVPALRLNAMTADGFDYAQRRYIPISDELALALAVMQGDLFVSRGNGSLHLVGRAVLAQEAPEPIVFPDTMIRVRLTEAGSLRRFANHAWASPFLRHQVERIARTTAGIYKISQRDVEGFVLPLPPTKEQGQIVAEIEEKLTLISAAERQIEVDLLRAVRLRQSILKRAFEGKLVPQDPHDDPASVLLERLHTTRSSHETNGKATAPVQTRGRRPKSKERKGSADE